MGAWPSLQQRLEDVWRAWPPKVIFRDVYLWFYFFTLCIWLCQVLAVARCLFSCSHAGSSSLTRDQSWAPYAGNVESQPLDHQGSLGCLSQSLFPCSQPTKWSESRSVVSDSLRPHGPYSPWNSPGQNTGVGKPFPSPGDLPNPAMEPRSSALQADSLPAEPQGKPSWPIA